MTLKPFAFAYEHSVRVKPLHLLLVAACWHLLTALAIHTAAYLSLLPQPFVADSMGQFAFDSFRYQQEAKSLAAILTNDGVAAWLRAPVQVQVHLYSIPIAIFGPLFGYSVLAVEPLNLLYYLASLMLVYRIGKEAYGKATGLMAAIVIGLWPSFLLHTTQVLKDPLFIVCMLVLVFICVIWLTRVCSWKSALLTLPIGAVSIAVLARMKSNMWESVVTLVAVGVMLLLARQAHARRVLTQNNLSAAMIVVLMLVMPVQATMVHTRDERAVRSIEQGEQTSFAWTSLGARIAERRRTFSFARKVRESNIDGDIVFHNTGDILRYLPRATLVGLFAPFPQMWFAAASTTGRLARVLAGVETLLFYLLALAAGICAYVERRNFSSWFLLLVALMNLIALGLVVTNIGTLFRLRYVFWMLIIIMGARGVVVLTQRFRPARSTSEAAV